MRKLIILFLLPLLLQACSGKKKLPLGAKEGPQLIEKTVFADNSKDSFYTEKVNTGSSLHLLLGKVPNEFESRILLSYTSYPDTVDRVESAKITFHTLDVLGDTLSSSFQANLYKLMSDWDETEILEWNEVSGGNILIASAEVFPQVGDSIVFELPPDLVEGWIDTLGGEENYGVYLESNGAEFMTDFYSKEAFVTESPVMELVYEHNSVLDTVMIFPEKDVFVLDENLNLDENSLYIGKGVAIRSLVQFNVSEEINQNATINRAELILKINQEGSLFEGTGATDIVVMRATSEAPDPQDIEIDSTFSGYMGSVLNDTVRVDLTGLFQLWSFEDEDFVNYGLILQSLGESENLRRVAFYGSSADSTLAPQILVRYTLPPGDSNY